MDALYSATFWLSLALLSVVAAIYVLAVSLLGRALEEARSRKLKAEQDAKNEFDDKIKIIESRMNEVKVTGDIRALERELEKVRRTKGRHEREIKKIEKRPSLLSLNQVVITPGFLLVVALSLSSAAKAVVDDEPAWLPISLWVVSVAFMAVAVYLLYRTLRVVEDVAVTSEPAVVKRRVDAFTRALEEHETAKRPELVLEWLEVQPPFSLASGEEKEIIYAVTSSKGAVARSPRSVFFAPEGFQFVGLPSTRQVADHSVAPNYFAWLQEFIEPFLPKIRYMSTLKLRALTKGGNYRLWYRLYCEGFAGDHCLFDVVVKEEEPPF